MWVRRVDDLVLDLVDEALGRGARRIEIRTEGRCATITYDAAESFARLEQLIGRGVAAVNALSEQMTIERHAAGRRQTRGYSRGRPIGPERDHGPSSLARTRISFMADPEIFGDAIFSRPLLHRELEIACALHPALIVELDGARLQQPRGLSGAVAELAGPHPLHPYPLRIAGNRFGIQVDLALQWRRSGPARVQAFINGSPGSTEGFRLGLIDAAWRPEISDEVIAELLSPGMVAMIAVEGFRRGSVGGAVREVTREGLSAHRRIIDRVIALRSRSSLL